MIKIGDFSKICTISIRTLHHWDKIGLLVPAYVDKSTGYRYYTIQQVRDVNRILALRMMGLSLEQIMQMLDETLTTSEIRAMFRLKQAELQQQIGQMRGMLVLLESRIMQSDASELLPDYEVSLRPEPAQTAIVVDTVVPDIPSLVDCLHEIHGYALRKGNTNLFAIFHDPAYDTQDIHVQIGFPISDTSFTIPLSENRMMTSVEIPPVELMSRTIHHGPWSTLSQGYHALGRWIDTNGYEIVDSGREIFHHLDWRDGNCITELQFPVQKVR